MKYYLIHCRNMARHTRQSKEGNKTCNKSTNEYKSRKRKIEDNDENKGHSKDINESNSAIVINEITSEENTEEIHATPLRKQICSNSDVNYSLTVSNTSNYDKRDGEINNDEKTIPSFCGEKVFSVTTEETFGPNLEAKLQKRSGANTCMVLSCLSPRQPGVIYHGFPKPNFPELQKQWLNKCGRSLNTVILRHMRVCR